MKNTPSILIVKRTAIVIISFFLSINILIAQQSEIDSLQTVVKNRNEDTLKVNILNLLSSELDDNGKFDMALQYADQALNLSQKLSYKKGEAVAFINFGNIYADKGNAEEALRRYNASLKIREQLGDNNNIAACYNNIGIVYLGLGNFPEALKNNFASLKLYKEIENQNGIAKSSNNIGNIFVQMGKYPWGQSDKHPFFAV